MPLFMDTHKGIELPPEMRKTVEERVRTGKKDEFGVVDRGIIIDLEANELHCVLEAPDTNAVMKHHEVAKVPLEHKTVHRADAILK